MKKINANNGVRRFTSIHPFEHLNGTKKEIRDIYFSTQEVRPYCTHTPYDQITIEDENVPEAAKDSRILRF